MTDKKRWLGTLLTGGLCQASRHAHMCHFLRWLSREGRGGKYGTWVILTLFMVAAMQKSGFAVFSRCAIISWIHAGESLSLLLSDSCYLLLQFFLIFSFFFSYRFPDWVLLDGVQWISLSIWCCVMNECGLLHENPFTTGKWYYYEKWGWFCNHFIYRPNKDSSKNVWHAILSFLWKRLHT